MKNCFLCESIVEERDVVNVGQKGIRGIEAASRERNHGKFQFLLDVTSLTVHKECRRQYPDPDSIERAKRGYVEDTVDVESSSLKQRLRKLEEAFTRNYVHEIAFLYLLKIVITKMITVQHTVEC